ncbi:hypothetical protein HDU90_006751 [Geranomyces variabilis]|nr:hypothetical protein HDU90_006751 [Geranomyces variabilis]
MASKGQNFCLSSVIPPRRQQPRRGMGAAQEYRWCWTQPQAPVLRIAIPHLDARQGGIGDEELGEFAQMSPLLAKD